MIIAPTFDKGGVGFKGVKPVVKPQRCQLCWWTIMHGAFDTLAVYTGLPFAPTYTSWHPSLINSALSGFAESPSRAVYISRGSVIACCDEALTDSCMFVRHPPVCLKQIQTFSNNFKPNWPTSLLRARQFTFAAPEAAARSSFELQLHRRRFFDFNWQD